MEGTQLAKVRYNAVFVDPATGEDIAVKFSDVTECRQFVEVGTWAHINVTMRSDYYE